MAVPKLPSYPPLHLFDGAVEHANSGGGTDSGDDEDGDSLCSLNLQGKAHFLFRGVPPVPLRVGDESWAACSHPLPPKHPQIEEE
jgi:hypothetical protein